MSSSPTKQGEIMAMGIPVICNACIGDTDTIVKKYNAGVVSKGNYANTIAEMGNFKTSAEDIRSGAIDFFSLKKGVDRYANVYQSLFEKV